MFVETSPRRERDFAMGMEVMLREVDFWRARMEGSPVRKTHRSVLIIFIESAALCKADKL